MPGLTNQEFRVKELLEVAKNTKHELSHFLQKAK
jgi:hypothetical protein